MLSSFPSASLGLKTLINFQEIVSVHSKPFVEVTRVQFCVNFENGKRTRSQQILKKNMFDLNVFQTSNSSPSDKYQC